MNRVLRSICYEQIKGDYWYGRYGFLTVVMMKSNCYINASYLCRQGDKLFKNWLRNQSARDEIAETHQYLQSKNMDEPMTITISHEQLTDLKGTYVHPYLIISIAFWVSPKFKCLVADIVHDHFAQLGGQAIQPHATVSLPDKSKHHQMVVLATSVDPGPSYYIVRAQKKHMLRRVAEVRAKFQSLRTVLVIPYLANAFDLYNKLRKLPEFHCRGNWLKSDLLEARMIERILEAKEDIETALVDG